MFHNEPCPACGGSVTQPDTGRPRVYCDPACRQKALRLRRKMATHPVDATVEAPVEAQDEAIPGFEHVVEPVVEPAVVVRPEVVVVPRSPRPVPAPRPVVPASFRIRRPAPRRGGW